MPDHKPPAPGAARASRWLALTWVALLDLLRRPAAFALLVGLLALYAGKLFWFMETFDPAKNPLFAELSVSGFLARDLFVMGSGMVVVVLLDNVLPWRWARALVTALALVAALLAMVAAFWLVRTGTQLGASVVQVALTRPGEVTPIAVSAARGWGVALLLLSLLAAVLSPPAFAARYRREGPHPPLHRWLGLAPPLLVAAVGGVMLASVQPPPVLGWRQFAGNVLWDMATHTPPGPSRPFPAGRPRVVRPDAAARAGHRPNVVIFIMEATSYRASSLGDPARNRTPFVRWLASQGLSAARIRAVMPHTTKSLVTLLCGHYPAMQTAVVEGADNFPLRCLPHMLRAAGYRSAFFQSADGKFEDRPRVVRNMGFDHFGAYPLLAPGTPLLGYLASDDRTLVQPAARWAASGKEPFLLVVLSSMTHHPYDPPAGVRISGGGDAHRYHVLVRETDLVVQNLYKALRARGVTERDVFIALGDHGESFGEHGLFQHDNVYFDEVLRVPLVIRAPGRLEPGTVVTGNRSLLDLTPTVLDLVGLPFDRGVLPGHTLLRSAPAVSRRFACWYDHICVGEVSGAHKLVRLPLARSWVRFDLTRDPAERRPEVEPPATGARARALSDWLDTYRYDPDQARRAEATLFGGRWVCGADDDCRAVGE